MLQNFKLKIELIPSTSWYSTIYQFYKKSNRMDKWRELKQLLFEREGRTCWICKTRTHRLEAHEFWKYNDQDRTQKLTAVHHICHLCHKIKHVGFWCHSADGLKKLEKDGLSKKDIIQHFCKVNNCTEPDFIKHEEQAFKIWRDRSNHKWIQNFGEYNPKYNLQGIKSQQKLNKFVK